MNADVLLKQDLIDLCQAYVDQRVQTLQNSMQDIQKSLASETKSSVGDKHETGRAMLQLEREKIGQQLAEAEKLNGILSRIPLTQPSGIIGLGSIVITSQANYFISISAGALKVAEQTFYAISSQTPIAELLLGQTVRNTVVFRTQHIQIKKVK